MGDEGRRPLRAYERVHLERLGRLLATTRRAVGVTQNELALAAGLSRVQVARIETGVRRTRRSTLTRIAAALVFEAPTLGAVERLVDDLVNEAGPALAEESAYAERVARRRAKRVERADRAEDLAEEESTFRVVREFRTERYRPEREIEAFRERLWSQYDEELVERRARRRAVEQGQVVGGRRSVEPPLRDPVPIPPHLLVRPPMAVAASPPFGCTRQAGVVQAEPGIEETGPDDSGIA